MKRIEDLTSSKKENQIYNDHPIAYSQPNPVRHQTAFSSNFNPFITPTSLFSPIGKVNSHEEKKENKESTLKANVTIAEEDSSFATPSGAKYSYNSDSNEEDKQEDEETDSDYGNDENNSDVIDLDAEQSEEEDDDEVLSDLVDDSYEASFLQDDLSIPLSEIREHSMEGRRLSQQDQKQSKKHKSHKKSCCSTIIKIIKFPFKLLSLFWITTIILSIILSRVTYDYLENCYNREDINSTECARIIRNDLYYRGRDIYVNVESGLTDLTEDFANIMDNVTRSVKDIYINRNSKKTTNTTSTINKSDIKATTNTTSISVNATSTTDGNEVKEKIPVPRKSKKNNEENEVKKGEEEKPKKINEVNKKQNVEKPVKNNDDDEVKKENKVRPLKNEDNINKKEKENEVKPVENDKVNKKIDEKTKEKETKIQKGKPKENKRNKKTKADDHSKGEL